MLLPIIVDPNPLLNQTAKKLSNQEIKSAKIQNLIKQMIPTMYLKDGVGLAAVQIGKLVRICIIHKNFVNNSTIKLNEGRMNEDLILINPVWEKNGFWQEWEEEGCLSVPNTYGQVKRFKKIKVEAIDRNGNQLKFLADNFLARIIQHEVDHLNGILFTAKAKNLKIYDNY